MQREAGFGAERWDDPFWHAMRMLVDEIPSRGKNATGITGDRVIPVLKSKDTPASRGLIGHLETRPHLVEKLAAYSRKRYEVADKLLGLMRTEEEAKRDFAELSDQALQSYGVKLDGYHKSSKVLVSTVGAIVHRECKFFESNANTDPQTRATVISDGHIWVSPRRLDGAIPELLNPVALWEIKEYWGVTSGGSKMSDAVYEIQLVGTELRKFEDEFGVPVKHYAIIDGLHQWTARKSDLRRAVDLVYSGLLDELIVGREVLTEWPRVVRDCCALVGK